MNSNPTLYTIGYETRTIGEYISILKANHVSLVIDIRKDSFSRKKGFSKNMLTTFLLDEGIGYRHLPELGIDSSLRKNLANIEDHKKLFEHYENIILPENQELLRLIEELLLKFGQVALTCFELDHACCHRHYVAKAFCHRYPICHL